MSTINSSASGTAGNGVYRTDSRVTGMFSSLDTDALVKSMTSSQQAKIDAVRQRQTRQEWYNESLTNIKADIDEFLNTYVSNSGASSMLKSASYATYKTTTASTANAVSISASSSAEMGNISIQINKLAQNASISSSNISAMGTSEISSSNTATLAELKFANSLQFNSANNIAFAINGKTFTFSKSTTLQNMINTINNDETANVTMKYSRLSNGFTITSDSDGEDSKVIIKNVSGNAFGTNSAFGISEGAITGTSTLMNSKDVSSGVDTSAALSSLSFAKDLTFDGSGNLSFSINGETFSFSKTTSLQNMLDTINNSATADVTMSYNSAADGFTINSDSGGTVTIANITGNAFGTDSAFSISEGTTSGDAVSSSRISGFDASATLENLAFAKKLTFDSSGNISFSINGTAFTFSKTATLQSMLDTINNDATAHVTMTYSSAADGFTFISDTGSDGGIAIKNISGNAFGTGSAFGIAETTATRGSDSEAVINGVTVKRSSNEYTIDGITYGLKKVTQGTSEERVDFTLEQDYSGTISSVSKFVDAYNKLFMKLKGLVNEDDHSLNYPPLTDAQKNEMSDDEIAAWEKKAKSGLLRHNSDLSSLLSNLKSSFYSALGGIGKNASEIGITTAGYFESNAGQLTLDEDKLSQALKNNPDEVIKMFTNGSSTAAAPDQGLIYKIKNSLSTYTTTVKNSMKTATDKISSYDNEISNLEDKLGKLADRYYKKFSNMETALSKLNSQSSYISQLFK